MTSKRAKRTVAENLYLDAMVAIAPLSGLSLLLLLIRIVVTGDLQYSFLVWNLFLAWVPALIAWRIVHLATSRLRLSAVSWLVAWILFLPNTFYILSDLIHLETLDGVSKLYDAVMIFTFSLTGFLLGLASIAIVHTWIGRYLKSRPAWIFVGSVILASSFAIYLGRYLRWNSWDIFLEPLGLLFDVSDRIINPGGDPRSFSTTFLFFGVIFTSYSSLRYFGAMFWKRIKSLR